MRGAPHLNVINRQPTGITPAYAGRTFPSANASRLLWDHPRVCGAHPFLQPPFPCFSGSPPRMRGALDGRGVGLVWQGITPAYAGRTRQPQLNFLYDLGSPPRMRGARCFKNNIMEFWGITPAYAGRTFLPPLL